MRNIAQIIIMISVLVFFSACGGDTKEVPLTIEKKIIDEEQPTQNVEANNTQTTIQNDEINNSQPDNNQTDEIPIEILADKKIYLIGASTVFIRGDDKFGWGNLLNTYMKTPENLNNEARGGASSRSYKEDSWRDWTQTKEFIKQESASTYLFIHFGNNDVARDRETAMDPNNKKTMPGRGESFYTELKEYILWSRDNGITPVLMTPVETMRKDDGHDLIHYYDRAYGDYVQTVRELAKDENVTLLDLSAKSWSAFNSYEDAQKLKEDFTVVRLNDYTHFSEKGAKVVAGWVKELACSVGDDVLCGQFK